MFRIVLRYGAIAGLVVAVPMVWSMIVLTPDTAPRNGALYGYSLMILALTAVFLGIKHYRDKVLGGVIKFVPALLVGLGISAVASLIYTIGWEVALRYTGFDMPAEMARMQLGAAHASGASTAELERLAADAAAFAKTYANPLYRLPITFAEMFPVGVLISLVSAGLLRNSRFLPAR